MFRNSRMHCRRYSIVASALTLVLIGASSGGAQPLPMVDYSVEWMTVTSPVIVLGTIEDITLQPNRFGLFKIDVSETLKGKHQKSVSFRRRIGNFRTHAAELRKLKNWKESDTEVLLFLSTWVSAATNEGEVFKTQADKAVIRGIAYNILSAENHIRKALGLRPEGPQSLPDPKRDRKPQPPSQE